MRIYHLHTDGKVSASLQILAQNWPNSTIQKMTKKLRNSQFFNLNLLILMGNTPPEILVQKNSLAQILLRVEFENALKQPLY